MEYERLFATRTRMMAANAIREILKVVSRPGMVSLAGGIPAPESFPLAIMDTLNRSVLETYGPQALQYDCSEGFTPLRQALVGYLEQKGISVNWEQILIGSGSQGILDALGKAFISKGDYIATEAPTYLGAISAFNPYEPRYVTIDTDEDGLIPESLERVLKSMPVKFVYLVPTFQNPTGRTLSWQRRQEVARILKTHDTLLVEDDPYSALRYRGENMAPIQTLAPDHVVYISTLSKVFCPGLRVGFCVAPEPIRTWLVRVKQGVDLHTSTYNQALSAEYITGGYLEDHIPKILNLYGARQTAMLEALDAYFPKSFQWSRPEGGMFLWVEGPRGLDMETVYHKAVARNTAFVPGKYFYPHPGEGMETMRLNFTMAPESVIDKAIRVLAEVAMEVVSQQGKCAA